MQSKSWKSNLTVKILALLSIAFFIFLASAPSVYAIDLPCVPSSTADGVTYKNDVFNCVNKLYLYGLVMSTIAAVFMIILAGYLYIFSGGNESRVGTAKSFVSTSLVGLAVLIVGFLILQQINPEILNIKNIGPGQIGQQAWFDSGENIEDTNKTPLTSSVTPPSGDAQSLAKQLLQAVGPNCFLSYQVASKKSDGATARDNITATSNGQVANRSSYGTAPGGTVALDSRMLGALLAIHQQNLNICPVTALAGGSHTSSRSAHYRGTAFDIDVNFGTLGDTTANVNQRIAICKQLGAVVAQYESASTHIHCQW